MMKKQTDGEIYWKGVNYGIKKAIGICYRGLSIGKYYPIKNLTPEVIQKVNDKVINEVRKLLNP